MSIEHKSIDTTALDATGVTVYTVGANAVAKSVSLSVYNGGGVTRIITVHKVPSGGSQGATNIISTTSVATLISAIIDEVSVQTMEAGDFLVVLQDTGTDAIVSGGAVEVST